MPKLAPLASKPRDVKDSASAQGYAQET